MRTGGKIVFLLPIAIVFGYFFLYPLVVLIMTSLRGADGALTLQNYTLMVTDAYYFKAVVNSLVLALATTLVSLVLSGVLAFFLARNEFF